MKIQIENLRAKMRGVQLNAYQKGLALDEYYKLLDYVEELEQLTMPAVMLRFFFVFVQIGTDEYKILAEGIDTYQDAVEIRDAYKSKFKNQPFVVASLNEAQQLKNRNNERNIQRKN